MPLFLQPITDLISTSCSRSLPSPLLPHHSHLENNLIKTHKKIHAKKPITQTPLQTQNINPSFPL